MRRSKRGWWIVLTFCVVLGIGAIATEREVARERATHALLGEMQCDCTSLGATFAPAEFVRDRSRAEALAVHPVVKRLLEEGADPNARTADDTSPVSWPQIFLQLVKAKLHPQPKVTVFHVNQWHSALYFALCQDPLLVADLLSHGANPNLPVDKQGRTPLELAMLARPVGDHETAVADVELLLRYGAGIRTRSAANALATAAAREDIAAAKLLIQHGADCRTGHALLFLSKPAVYYTLVACHADLLDLLLTHGAEVHWQDPQEGAMGYTVDGVHHRVIYHTLGEYIRGCAGNPAYADVIRVLKAHGVMPAG
jgi:hypothetical protein